MLQTVAMEARKVSKQTESRYRVVKRTSSQHKYKDSKNKEIDKNKRRLSSASEKHGGGGKGRTGAR